MITRGEDVEASALRQRGWSMSAIAAVPRCCGPAPLGEMLGGELGVGDGPSFVALPGHVGGREHGGQIGGDHSCGLPGVVGAAAPQG